MATHICSSCGTEESIFGDGGGEKVADQYQTKLLGSLPLDRAIREQGDAGKPISISQIKPEITSHYMKIAEHLMAQLEQLDTDSSPQIVFE